MNDFVQFRNEKFLPKAPNLRVYFVLKIILLDNSYRHGTVGSAGLIATFVKHLLCVRNSKLYAHTVSISYNNIIK